MKIYGDTGQGFKEKVKLSSNPSFPSISHYPLTPFLYFTHSEGALCAFAGALWQPPSTKAGWDSASYPGASVTVRPHHGLHGVAPDTHGSLEEGGRGNRV